MLKQFLALPIFGAAICLPGGPALAATPAPVTRAAVTATPTVYIVAQDAFQSALVAAFVKKKVPATVVADEKNATYTLKSADVIAKSESTGSKVTRCLFADCIGIEGTATVSVQLIRNSDDAIVWAYQVRKGNAGPAGIQSLSEAIAKHVKNDFFNKQTSAKKTD
jgi:hypothetical protein